MAYEKVKPTVLLKVAKLLSSEAVLAGIVVYTFVQMAILLPRKHFRTPRGDFPLTYSYSESLIHSSTKHSRTHPQFAY